MTQTSSLPASFIAKTVQDPARRVNGAPPNFGREILPHIFTVSGRITDLGHTYPWADEALRDNRENAEMMRTECGIMECLEARQRGTALLRWHIEPRDSKDESAKDLARKVTDIIQETWQFLELRRNLLEALWYGRYLTSHRFGTTPIGGASRQYIRKWTPRHGDKIVFRFDDGTGEYSDDQIGIRVSGSYQVADTDWAGATRRKTQATQHGLVYWLDDWERKMVAIHRHLIEDASFWQPRDMGRVNGIGIRDRIYWTWYAMQECLVNLLNFIERSAYGIEVWKFPAGNPLAEKRTIDAAKNRSNKAVIIVPVQPGEMSDLQDVEIIEPGFGGADTVMGLIKDYFGHKIKRYILGQTLTSEAEATGLGSGVADAHMATYADIILFDALKLAETITTDIIRPVQVFNFPDSADVRLVFRIDTQAEDMDRKLEAWERAWNMGAELSTSDVMATIGARMPDKDEQTLKNPQFSQAAQQAMGQWPGKDPGPWKPSSTSVFGPMRPKGGDGAGLTDNPDGPEKFAATADHVDKAAGVTVTPSDAQREAGNYRKGKVWLHGIEVAIETPKGEQRRPEWPPMAAHYGYIRRTEGRDGDQVDVFVGPHPESEIVFVIDQQTPGGRFDEHKVMLGWFTEREAVDAYRSSYQPGWRVGPVTSMTIDQFREWLKSGDQTVRIENQVSRYERRFEPLDVEGPIQYGRQKRFDDEFKGSSGKQGRFQWITIGGGPGDKGEHEGGTPVLIDSEGKIHAGPSELSGKHLSDLDRDKEKPGAKTPETDTDEKLQQFATDATAAAKSSATGQFGDNKVFLSHVWNELRKKPTYQDLSLEDFKKLATQASNKSLLTLSRADLVERMDPRDVAESETTPELEGQKHFLTLAEEKPKQPLFDREKEASEAIERGVNSIGPDADEVTTKAELEEAWLRDPIARRRFSSGREYAKAVWQEYQRRAAQAPEADQADSSPAPSESPPGAAKGADDTARPSKANPTTVARDGRQFEVAFEGDKWHFRRPGQNDEAWREAYPQAAEWIEAEVGRSRSDSAESTAASEWERLPEEGRTGFETHVVGPLREQVEHLNDIENRLGKRYAWEVATKSAQPGDPHAGSEGLKRWAADADKHGFDSKAIVENHQEYNDLVSQLEAHRGWGTEPTSAKSESQQTTKHPWQMARGEWHASQRGQPGYDIATANRQHKQAVADALQAGEDVPPESYQDYPDLADLAQRQAAGEGAPNRGADGPKEPAPPVEDTPRDEAAVATEQQLSDPDEYAFARKSTISNAGEDVAQSARHKANMWKGLEDAERDGTAAEMVTREKLLKNEPHNLMAHVQKNPLTSLAMFHTLKNFPPKPGYGKYYKPDEETAKKDRAQYLASYQRIKSVAEELARDQADPVQAINTLRETVSSQIRELRGQKSNDYMGQVTASDRYNATANALCGLANKLNTTRLNASSIAIQTGKFASAFKDRYQEGLESSDKRDKVVQHVSDIMEGRSLNETFGAKSEGGAKKDRFSPADLYVNKAVRVGGQQLEQKSPQELTHMLTNDMGMRAIQWGNSVSDDERKHHLTKASEAFVDLADIVGLPVSAISGEGKLALAIGARGTGRALAHYEPGQKVINLTRKNGVGSLAHEWGHFFDHYLGGLGISKGEKSASGDYLSTHTSAKRFVKEGRQLKRDEKGNLVTEDKSSDPTWKAMDDVRKSWAASGYRKRLGESLNNMVKEGRMKRGSGSGTSFGMTGYWTSDQEMLARSFERYCQRKLEASGRKNTYLSGYDARRDQDGLWPTDAEVDAMAPAFDKLFETVKQERYGHLSKNVVKFENDFARAFTEAYQKEAGGKSDSPSLDEQRDNLLQEKQQWEKLVDHPNKQQAKAAKEKLRDINRQLKSLTPRVEGFPWEMGGSATKPRDPNGPTSAQERNVHEAARDVVGDSPEDIAGFTDLVREIWERKRQEAQEENSALRDLLANFGVEAKAIGGFVAGMRRGTDYDKKRKFDQMVEMAEKRYPQLLDYGTGESDAQGHADAALFRRLQRGLVEVPTLDSPDVIEEAAEYFAAAGRASSAIGAREDWSATPFSRRSSEWWQMVKYAASRWRATL